jgi:FAD/FMN-containing dehydrogenase
LLGDVDHATHAFGLATPAGIISNTGVGGLTLGGGIGHLTRKLGLTIDNIIEADVVLASGEFVKANAKQNPDLYWAIRGGGGNFGVVTSFLYRLHPVSTVVAGPTLYDIDKSEVVLRWWQDFIGHAPEDLNGFFAFLIVPPVAPFPTELHMRQVCAVVWTYAGAEDKADEVFAPIRKFGPPLLYGVQPLPLPAWQSAFDGLYPKGTQMYWRAEFMNELSDEAIAVSVKHGSVPTVQSTAHIYPIDGAAHRIGPRDTAWRQRNVRFAQVVLGDDGDPANAGMIRDWAVKFADDIHPFTAGGAYVNFIMDEGQERVRATYGENYDRLAKVKAQYDPKNLFHINQNIRPA